MTTHRTPEKKFRIGAVAAAIWNNPTEDGKSLYSVTFGRTYRSEDGLKSASGFHRRDLLNVAKLAERAEAYIAEQTA